MIQAYEFLEAIPTAPFLLLYMWLFHRRTLLLAWRRWRPGLSEAEQRLANLVESLEKAQQRNNDQMYPPPSEPTRGRSRKL